MTFMLLLCLTMGLSVFEVRLRTVLAWFVAIVVFVLVVEYATPIPVVIPKYACWSWFFVFVAMMIGARYRFSAPNRIVCVGGGICLAFIATGIHIYPDYRIKADRSERLVKLKKQYQVESLRDRLAYESTNADRDNTIGVLPAWLRSKGKKSSVDHFERSLEQNVESMHGWLRSRELSFLTTTSLRIAHVSFVGEFIDADGFGFIRRSSFHVPDSIEIDIPELTDISIPRKSTQPTSKKLSSEELNRQEKTAKVSSKHMKQFHLDGTLDFVNPRGFGYIAEIQDGTEYKADLSHVIGFQAHAFRKMPEPVTSANKTVRWQIEELDLISLLKHKTPRAYISDNLPRMDELRDAPTRALDEFETYALEKLRDGEAIVIQQQRNQIRMLGPILAADQCLKCHNVDRGDLLGAFTYRLRRTPQLPESVESTDVLLY